MAWRKSMRSSRRLKLRQNWQRRLISLAVFVGICATMFPLPIGWQTQTEKDLSSPFPCQHRACGCKSAEQCWKKCCCFSNSQKLAWAEANQVAAPSYVAVAAAKERSDSACQSAVCCTQSGNKKCAACQTRSRELPVRACCRSTECAEVTRNAVQNSSNEVPQTRLILSVFWHKCQGQGWFWNSLPWAIVVEHDELISRSAVAGDFVSPHSLGLPQWFLRPPVPPPRYSPDDAIYS